MVPSIIGEDLTITGNVTSKGEIQIDGEIQGDIRCSSLLVGDKAQVRGGVVAEDIVVRGHMVGSLRGLRITLQAQSHVEGDIFHQSIAIEQGAYFEGKSRRSDNPLAEIKAPDASSSKLGSFESRPAGSLDSSSISSPSMLPPAAE
jgi:cytoskeletal protein CcmA (bactofilin family)